MKVQQVHPWDISPREAIALQNKLRQKIVLKKALNKLSKIAGADAAFTADGKIVWAAVLVFDFPKMNLLEERHGGLPVTFPYIPGLLTFREGPALIKAFEQLKNEPDLILFDGQGIAHPRKIGIATHLGILLEKPTIGCAKKVLVGEYLEPANRPGAYSDLKKDSQIVGAVVRTKKNVKPVFVSPGFKMDIKTSIEVVLQSCSGYRLPEPVRQAHNFANRLRSSAIVSL